jgi:hypothetical protein
VGRPAWPATVWMASSGTCSSWPAGRSGAEERYLPVTLPEYGRRHLGAVDQARQVQHRPDVDVERRAGTVAQDLRVGLWGVERGRVVRGRGRGGRGRVQGQGPTHDRQGHRVGQQGTRVHLGIGLMCDSGSRESAPRKAKGKLLTCL